MTQNQNAQEVQVRRENGQLGTHPRRLVTPPADVLKRRDRIAVTLDMPGVDPGSLEVTFSEGLLRVRGQGPQPEADSAGGVTYAEFELGDYERSFRVGERIDSARISAELVEGTLTVELPIEQPAQTRVAVRTS